MVNFQSDGVGGQDKGRAERNSFLGVSSGAFRDSSASGNNQFVEVVDDAIKQWTKMWENDARYDNAVANNVQVASNTQQLDDESIEPLFVVRP